MPNQAAVFEFGPFRLEPAERRLVRDRDAVPLTPKSFDLLVFLVEHADRLLKKEELLEHLWPGVFVEEVNLAQNISSIRRALGGDGRDAYIQTIAGTGYRFVAPVRASSSQSGSNEPAATTTAVRKRLLVLPFRMLKPDPDLDFLGFSLPDALTAELSAFNSLIVRSSLVAARFAGDAPDLRRIAQEAQVDFVVSGTVLSAGNGLRVSAQLSDAAAGTVVWSHTTQAPVGDLFRLQDSFVAKIVGSLARPLTDRAARQDVPATAAAYDLFLRANEAARKVTGVAFDDAPVARDLYLQSLREDPNYAPAWARVARIYRVAGKYQAQDAEANLNRADDALQRALAINPDLAVAHNMLAQIDVDRGDAPGAMRRLLELLRRQGPHAEVFAGLVQACRCSGLLDESAAAHDQAERLDAAIETGVMHTYFLQRRYEDAIAACGSRKGGYVWGLSMAALGRGDIALPAITGQHDMFAAVRALLDGRRRESIELMTKGGAALADPEGFYYAARFLSHLDATDVALQMLTKAVNGGYACLAPLEDDPWFDSLRGTPDFDRLVSSARERHDIGVRVFRDAGGATLLAMR